MEEVILLSQQKMVKGVDKFKDIRRDDAFN